MHRATGPHRVDEQAQARPAPETDVGGDPAGRHLRSGHRRRDGLAVTAVQCSGDDSAESSVRAPQLSGHAGEQSLA
ncbi:hypothetical protein MDOR_13520 [Mycolicibacterium doricum]|uniref:Uncharacterized protein n=1 Tax=Mycolicibacterium doricum TaxID=126673 RepID=A0A7I7VSM9_9MYCO|nr:hypothetical protein MDOR_13520 [Mycolicibacterium doricum]